MFFRNLDRASVFVLAFLAGVVAAEPLDQSGKVQPWKGDSDRFSVIDFAAEWCVPCWKTLPEFQKLADRFPQLRFLVVSVDEKERGRDRLVEELGLTVPVLWDEEYLVAEHYGPEAMPATYIVSPDGEIVHHHTGSSNSDWGKFIALVEDLGARPMETLGEGPE